MQSDQKAEETIKALEVIFQRIKKEDLNLTEAVEEGEKARKIYDQFSKNFTRETFSVKTLESNGETLSFKAFDWQKLYENGN